MIKLCKKLQSNSGQDQEIIMIETRMAWYGYALISGPRLISNIYFTICLMGLSIFVVVMKHRSTDSGTRDTVLGCGPMPIREKVDLLIIKSTPRP